MKTAKYLILLLFGVCLLASCHHRPAHGVEVKPQTVDLGVVYTDSTQRTFEVAYTNIGSQPLVIADIRPDCDCTSTTFAPSYVQSGKSGKLTVTIDLRRLSPQRFEKHVAMYFDDIKDPVMISIKGEVKRK